ncbi:MAG: nitroreductase [bacterium]
MKVEEALQQRKSVRAFSERQVDEDVLRAMLLAAGHSPSGANIQPWKVAVVRGAAQQRLQQQLEQAFREGAKPDPDYSYYPEQWLEPYKSRRVACGQQLYAALDIAREDRQRRLDQWAANYRSFEAPITLLFYVETSMETGAFLDVGMFMQSFMLMAVERGLATCPQAAMAEYPGIVKQVLGLPGDSTLMCGMALGYENEGAAVNSYRTPRESVEAFTQFFD